MDSETLDNGNDVFDNDLSSLEVPGFDTPKTETAKDPSALAAEAKVEVAEDAAPITSETKSPEDTEADAVAKAAAAKVAAATTATGVVAKEPKQLTFKAGDSSVPLMETATIDWKVDGKVQPIAVKDLLENFAGKVAWDRKYQEVANERKQVASQVQEFDNVRTRHGQLITEMHSKAAEGKIFEAVKAMIDMNGLGEKIDARQYVKNLRDSLMQQAQELSKLTPEQRELFEVKEEQEYTKSQYTQALQRQKQEQAERAFQDRVTKAMGKANTTIEEFVQTRDGLSELIRKQGGDLNAITPEVVADQIGVNRNYKAAREILESVDPELMKNEKLWDQAAKMLRDNPDWSADDVKEVFKEAVQKKRAATVSKKVAGAPVATVAKAGTKPNKAKSSKEDFTSFSESDLSW